MENLNHLRQILALAETGNYRKAGERLGVSHSAISQTVAKLEGIYEVRLFEKQNSETKPTAFGLRIIESAKNMVRELDRATRDLNDLEDQQGGALIIGVDPTLCESLIAPAIAQTIDNNPNLMFQIKVTAPGKEIIQLRERNIDMFVGLKPDEMVADLHYTEIKLKPPAVLCKKSHPLANRSTITISDMEPFPCIAGELPEWIKTHFNNRHISATGPYDRFSTIFLISQSNTLARQMLMHGKNTVAVLPKEVVKRELKSGLLKELQLEPPVFAGDVTGVIAINRDSPLIPAAAILTRAIQNMTSRPAPH